VRRIILSLVINGLSLYAASLVVPGITLRGVGPAILAAVVLALANTFIRPVLVFLTLPVTIVSLGLFIFVINALIFLLVSRLVSGFEVHGFGPAFWGALITSIVSWLLHLIF